MHSILTYVAFILVASCVFVVESLKINLNVDYRMFWSFSGFLLIFCYFFRAKSIFYKLLDKFSSFLDIFVFSCLDPSLRFPQNFGYLDLIFVV